MLENVALDTFDRFNAFTSHAVTQEWAVTNGALLEGELKLRCTNCHGKYRTSCLGHSMRL